MTSGGAQAVANGFTHPYIGSRWATALWAASGGNISTLQAVRRTDARQGGQGLLLGQVSICGLGGWSRRKARYQAMLVLWSAVRHNRPHSAAERPAVSDRQTDNPIQVY
jgi:hypothetical protein